MHRAGEVPADGESRPVPFWGLVSERPTWSGVLNSCDMAARNCLLARLASSARARARRSDSYSSARWAGHAYKHFDGRAIAFGRVEDDASPRGEHDRVREEMIEHDLSHGVARSPHQTAGT